MNVCTLGLVFAVCVDQLCILGLLFDSVGLIRNCTLAMDRGLTNSCSHACMAGLSRALVVPKYQKRSQQERLFAEIHIWVCVTQFAPDASFSTPTHSYTHHTTNTLTYLYYIILYIFQNACPMYLCGKKAHFRILLKRVLMEIMYFIRIIWMWT